MSQISIFKASAGSGKTFKLTGEYLKILFKNQGAFNNILAVTFTNKATAEMRERILKELHTIACGEKSDHAADIIETCKIPEQTLPLQAKNILHQILHNYSRFNISTIDSFFQRILKAFTREIGLNVGFNIELNPKPIIEKAVDALFEDISEDKDLEKWLGEYAFHKVQEGKSWDIYKDLIDFSNSGFSEVFFSFDEEHLKELLNLNNFKKLNTQLSQIIKDFLAKVHKAGAEFEKLITAQGLSVDDFSNKNRGVAGYFVNKIQNCNAGDFELPGAYALKAINSTDGITGWVAKKSPKTDEIQSLVAKDLQSLVVDYYSFVERNSIEFFSAIVVQKNLNVFAVLVEIFKKVLDYCNDNNLFLLPLATPFLAKMIEDEDAPFIYEKTGEYLNHFMIDEFQDTSQMQWKNFSPLVLNSISQNNASLVVGDVKQSIYRWRNSDWGLLESELANQFKHFNVKEETLAYNWRSSENVIRFNNWCFNVLSTLTQQVFDSNNQLENSKDGSEIIRRIYEGGAQKIPDKSLGSEGFVELQFFEDDFNESTLEYVVNTIELLHNKGYEPKDIAILVRWNKEGALIAKHLMECQKRYPEKEELFRFVSSDSVFLGSSDMILLLIAALNFLNTDNRLNRINVLYFYFSIKHGANQAMEMLYEIDVDSTEAFLKTLPKAFSENQNEFKQKGLVDLVNGLIHVFLLNGELDKETVSSNLPFIHTFQDVVLNFSNQSGNDIDGFIEWWNEKGSESPINLTDEQNAIRIMTIHKSKGLEFKAVIMPFLNWKFEPKGSLLWCKTEKEPYHNFRLLPVNYSSKLKNTWFSDYYEQEYLKLLIDNLNLLYVGFTRAENALFLAAPKIQMKKNGKYSGVGHLMNELLNNQNILEKLDVQPKVVEENTGSFSCGELPVLHNEIEVEEPELYTDYSFGNCQHKLRIRLQGKEIESLNDDAQLTPRKKGSVYHKIFEFINHKEDLYTAVDKVIRIGLLNEAERKQYIDDVTGFIESDSCSDWYSGKWTVYNERSFMLKDGRILRPDRIIENSTELIIIDYKFTNSEHAKYKKQVLEYMQIAKTLTSKTVKGFVWYVMLNKQDEVT